jgi:hypothetical protein
MARRHGASSLLVRLSVIRDARALLPDKPTRSTVVVDCQLQKWFCSIGRLRNRCLDTLRGSAHIQASAGSNANLHTPKVSRSGTVPRCPLPTDMRGALAFRAIPPLRPRSSLLGCLSACQNFWQDGKVGKVIMCPFSGKDCDARLTRAVPPRKNCDESEANRPPTLRLQMVA